MAGYNGQGRPDIPIHKNNKVNTGNQQNRTYNYDELVKRANGQADSGNNVPKQQNIPVQRNQNIPVQRNQNIPVQRQTSVQYNQQMYNNGQYMQQGIPVQRQQPVRPQQQVMNNQYAEPRQKNFNDYRNEQGNRLRSSGRVQVEPPAYSAVDEKRAVGKRKKKHGGFFKFIFALFLVAVIAYVGVTGYIYSVFSNVDYNNTGNDNSTESIVNMFNKDYVYNVLLLGVDERQEGQPSRSDTMMLVSVDKTNKQIKILSFMRDTYVEIPGHGSAKLNAACTYGGPELVMETIEFNFDIKIDNYVLVDFTAFKDIVDSLGGVTVEVTQKEAEFINRTTRQTVDYGEEVELNGEEALVYVRIRKLDSDFYRTQRQRKVISAIIDSAKKSNPVELMDTAEKVMEYIETDMSPLELTFFAENVALCLRYDMVQAGVPFDNAYSNQMINGQAVLAIDKEKTKGLVHNFIYEKVEEPENAEK